MSAKQASSPAFFAWPSDSAASPAVTVTTQMYNEEGGAAALVAEIAAACADIDHEIIVVDDGSTDHTPEALAEAAKTTPQLRVIRHRKNAGQSRALRTGVLAARGKIIAALDGDGQNDPADLPALLTTLQERPPPLAMVGGERQARQDSASKKWASGLANSIRRRLLKDGAADAGCGIKVFYREAFLRLPYFDRMHVYMPALMRREGFEAAFQPVSHRPRVHGASKYTNIGRFLLAIPDVLGVLWLLGRAQTPESIEESGE